MNTKSHIEGMTKSITNDPGVSAFENAPQTAIMHLCRYLGIDLEADYEAIIKECLELEKAHQEDAFKSGQLHAHFGIEHSFADWWGVHYFPESLNL